MLKLITIITAFFLFGCGYDEFGSATPKEGVFKQEEGLKEFYDNFVKDLKYRNIRPLTTNVAMSWSDDIEAECTPHAIACAIIGQTWFSSSLKNESLEYRRAVVVHELFHSQLGLNHTEDPGSIMYYAVTRSQEWWQANWEVEYNKILTMVAAKQ